MVNTVIQFKVYNFDYVTLLDDYINSRCHDNNMLFFYQADY